jgi:hypothetical protein
MNTKVRGGIVAAVGYILSPFSWWNDLIINLPIAYAAALPFGFVSAKFFVPALITAYWATNIAGLILMHRGIKNVMEIGQQNYSKKELVQDLSISILYTGVIASLVYMGWLKFPFT